MSAPVHRSTRSPRPPPSSGGGAGWSRGRTSPLGERAGDLRGIWIGVACTVLAHLALWWLAPHLAVLSHDPAAVAGNRSFLIEMSPDTFAAPEESAPMVEPAPPDRFVEVNPDAPDNVPDETRNFGSQNQQLAQPEPSPDAGDAPAIKGEDDDFGAAIVSGQLAPRPLPVIPASPPAPAPADETPAETPTAKQEELPRPGPADVSGDNPDGLATTGGERPGAADRRVDGAADGRPDGYALLSGRVVIDPKKPQPRPVLPSMPAAGTARSAPLLNNPVGTQNIGAVAYDAKWSDHGAYLQKLIETVQVQWERLILSSRIYPVPGTKVSVTFLLNRRGEVERIVKVDGSDDHTAGYLCVNAIAERSPYGEWSEDMINVLGESQEITFRFHYQ